MGPEHAYYQEIGRADYFAVSDTEALEGFRLLSEKEGIIPALEPSHAIFYLTRLSRRLKKNSVVIVCLSGRGDKDLGIINKYLTKSR